MDESMVQQDKPQRALIMSNERECLLEKMERIKKQRVAEEEKRNRAKLDYLFIKLFCDFCESFFGADGRALSQLNDQEFLQLDRMFVQHAEQLLEKREKSWRRRRIAALCVPGIGWIAFALSAMSPPDVYDYYEANIFGIYRERRGQVVRNGETKWLYFEDYPVLRKAVLEKHKDDPAPLAFLSEGIRQELDDKKAQLPASQNDGVPKALPA